jgi:regulator of sigma E protease
MDFLIKVGQLLLSLSILIVLHEMGHFLPAKWFKTRVEKFYLFFDAPPFNSLWKKTKGETEYGIGWLPLGGYVKISGMVDESMDTEFKNQPPQPWEFRSKPAWQRLIIMLGGVTVNFILGFFIFAMILWTCGRDYLPSTELKQYGTAFDSILIQQGFQNGDVITKIGDQPFERFETVTFLEKVVLGNERNVTVLRDGQEQTVRISDDIARKVTDRGVPKSALLAPRFPFFVGSTAPASPAEKAGLLAEDQIIRFNSKPTEFYDQFVIEAQSNKGKPVEIGIIRNSDTLNVSLTMTDEGTIGVYAKNMNKLLHFEKEEFSLLKAIPEGYKDGVNFLGSQISAFGKMFSGQISANKNLGSFISIGNMFPKASEFSWEAFWHLTATLSLVLAFMNLLPIPGLDGGYVMFLIWEVVTGRKVSDSFLEKAVTVGFFLLIGLMVYALGLDLWRHLFSRFF